MIHWSPTVYPAKCQSPMHHVVLTPNLDESSGNSSCVGKQGHTTCSSEFFIIVIPWLWISFAFLYQSNLCCLQRVQIDVKHDAFIQSRQRGWGAHIKARGHTNLWCLGYGRTFFDRRRYLSDQRAIWTQKVEENCNWKIVEQIRLEGDL